MAKKKDPSEIKAVLSELQIGWTEHNNGLHLKVKDLRLDIWPTRWKTMHGGQVIRWDCLEMLSTWLGQLQASDGRPAENRPPPHRKPVQESFVPKPVIGPPIRTKPAHDFPLYDGDIPPWDEACLEGMNPAHQWPGLRS